MHRIVLEREHVMTRSEARETAFILIFEASFHNDLNIPEFYTNELENMALESDTYIESTFNGVYKNISELDGLISGSAKGWTVDRMSKVTLAILRLCIYEMLYVDDVPTLSAIDEAIELAKKYDHDNAPAFINGIVNAVADAKGIKDK